MTHGPKETESQDSSEAFGCLRFEKIELQASLQSDRLVPLWGGIEGWRACGEQLDVLWRPDAVYFMKWKGQTREVFKDSPRSFMDVAWDGRNVWIGTRRNGIWVVSPAGKILAKLGADQDLPPNDEGLLLHPLRPGYVIAVGSYGRPLRAWCAALEGPDDRSVRVFHWARETPTASQTGSKTLSFRPKWIHEYHGGQGAPRTLLVGRDSGSYDARRHPLEIRVDELEVYEFERELYQGTSHTSSLSYFSRDGQILEASDFNVVHLQPHGQTFDNGKDWRYVVPPGRHSSRIANKLLLHDGWLYVPGVTWHRIQPSTFSGDRLVPGYLPQPYNGFSYYAVSAHYGLVAWDHKGNFYKIEMAHTPPCPRKTDTQAISPLAKNRPGGIVFKAPSRKAQVRGDLSREQVVGVVRKHLRGIKYCYEKNLLLNPKLAGKLVMEWGIDSSGSVGEVVVKHNSLQSLEVARCVSSKIKTWRFPRPTGEFAVVTFPFIFNSIGF